MRPTAARLAPLLAFCLVACGAQASPPPRRAAAPLPAGYQRYDSRAVGFQLGLAPGWQQAADGPDGVEFADPSRQGTLLVHVEQARSTDLVTATGAVIFDLTGGGGATGGTETGTTLAGRPARRVRGAFDANGAIQQLDAVVTIVKGRAWVLALAGPADRVSADQGDFDRMLPTFEDAVR